MVKNIWTNKSFNSHQTANSEQKYITELCFEEVGYYKVYICRIHIFLMCLMFALPVHLKPSPIHPGAQLHLKLPAVLVHVACRSQLCAPISHSLISVKERRNKLISHNGYISHHRARSILTASKQKWKIAVLKPLSGWLPSSEKRLPLRMKTV